MTQLESNIISSAKALVNDIRSYAGLTGLPRDVDALIGAHHGLSALVELSLVVNNGFSTEAVAELDLIHKDACKAMGEAADHARKMFTELSAEHVELREAVSHARTVGATGINGVSIDLLNIYFELFDQAEQQAEPQC